MKNKIVNINLKAEATDNVTDYHFNVGLYIFKEGDYYVAYSPAFDLSSYAETFNEVISAFYEAFQMHIEYCVENKTLVEDLKAHGWTVKNKKVKEPSIKHLLQNKTINSILSRGFNYQYIVSSVSIPSLAL